MTMTNLILVLGDQLDRNSSAMDEFEAAHDAVWMVASSGLSLTSRLATTLIG